MIVNFKTAMEVYNLILIIVLKRQFHNSASRPSFHAQTYVHNSQIGAVCEGSQYSAYLNTRSSNFDQCLALCEGKVSGIEIFILLYVYRRFGEACYKVVCLFLDYTDRGGRMFLCKFDTYISVCKSSHPRKTSVSISNAVRTTNSHSLSNFRHIGNRYTIRRVFKKKEALRLSLMRTTLEGNPHQMTQHVYIVFLSM